MREVFSAFLRLGLTSFGGPIAHLAYFRTEFVERRSWLTEQRYGELLALCQFLPGPASSQLAFALGLLRAGWSGAIAAFVAFTLPSVALLVVFAYADAELTAHWTTAALHGLKLTAVCIVAHAVIGMARSLVPDLTTRCIAIGSALVMLLAGTAWVQIAAIVVGAVTAAFIRRDSTPVLPHTAISLPYGKRLGGALLAILCALFLLALLVSSNASPIIQAAAGFYRAGALVFGGGHVVLPLLQETVVQSGVVSADAFMNGYGAAQAVPGPMFSLAAYLGTKIAGVSGALLSVLAIFLPGFLLVGGALPFWSALSAQHTTRVLMRGANASVVGILAAAFYDPVLVTGITQLADVAIAATGLLLLLVARWPALGVVAWCVVSSIAIALLH